MAYRRYRGKRRFGSRRRMRIRRSYRRYRFGSIRF